MESSRYNLSTEEAVKESLTPRYIYKYRSISSFTEKIFSKSQLWFSAPKDFNDPFDCQIVIDADNSVDDIENFYNRYPRILNRAKSKDLIRYYTKNKHEWKRMVNQTLGDKINEHGVCCFAGNGDNILMWSHYGDSHRGICIKFDILADLKFFAAVQPVKYEEKYPKYNYLKNNGNFGEFLVLTKSHWWHYEEEVRAFTIKAGPNDFSKSAVMEIIFGCNCKPEDIKRIKTLVIENQFPNVKFMRAAKSSSMYKLNIKPL